MQTLPTRAVSVGTDPMPREESDASTVASQDDAKSHPENGSNDNASIAVEAETSPVSRKWKYCDSAVVQATVLCHQMDTLIFHEKINYRHGV